ncbi:acetyl esterase/lipase [Psychrobacter sp. PL19]|uniref:alpha/beta hydrolase fold domain-containing protein n=1 Tax=Psychrobacter sp. PL19 TaxID=2760711 RepID=UPI001AE8DB47
MYYHGGDSAGGNLAAVVAQQTKLDQDSPMLQLLWVPWVDMSTERSSYDLFGDGFFLDRSQARWYIDHYINNESNKVDPLVSPLFGDVSDVAPAVILVAGFDVLRDEGIEYAQKLKDAGVDTELKIYETLPHPFMNMAGEIDDARVAFSEAAKILKERLSDGRKAMK